MFSDFNKAHEINLRRCLDEKGLEWEMNGLLKAANKVAK